MLFQIAILIVSLAVAHSEDKINSNCSCPPPIVCPSPPTLCPSETLNISDKKLIQKIQSGKLKAGKKLRYKELPEVQVESETHSHIQKRSTPQDSLIPDDDSDLMASGSQPNWLDRKSRKHALSAKTLEENKEQSSISDPSGNNNEAMVDIKCNSHVLKKLMLENIKENSSVSKRAINDRAEEKFGGTIDVICSKGHFSYVYSSNLYCEATKGDITCIAFRQSH